MNLELAIAMFVIAIAVGRTSVANECDPNAHRLL